MGRCRSISCREDSKIEEESGAVRKKYEGMKIIYGTVEEIYIVRDTKTDRETWGKGLSIYRR